MNRTLVLYRTSETAEMEADRVFETEVDGLTAFVHEHDLDCRAWIDISGYLKQQIRQILLWQTYQNWRCRKGSQPKRYEIVLIHNRHLLADSPVEYFWLKKILHGYGVELICAQPDLDFDSSLRRVIREWPERCAQLDRYWLGFRLQNSRLLKRNRGEYGAGAPAFGYQSNNGRIIENPEEHTIVDLVLSMHLAGQNFTQIADQLNQAGHLSKRGSRFYPQTIKNIITYQRKANPHVK